MCFIQISKYLSLFLKGNFCDRSWLKIKASIQILLFCFLCLHSTQSCIDLNICKINWLHQVNNTFQYQLYSRILPHPYKRVCIPDCWQSVSWRNSNSKTNHLLLEFSITILLYICFRILFCSISLFITKYCIF